jgi:hypothetical protein
VFASLLIAFQPSKGATPPPKGSVIRIGVIVATEGAGALMGGSFLKAIELAKEELHGTTRR